MVYLIYISFCDHMNHAIKSSNYRVIPQKTIHLLLPALHYEQIRLEVGVILGCVSVDTDD